MTRVGFPHSTPSRALLTGRPVLTACLPARRVGVDPWATFPTGLVSPKPHRRLDPAAAALQAAVQRDGKLRLRHFSRVRLRGAASGGQGSGARHCLYLVL